MQTETYFNVTKLLLGVSRIQIMDPLHMDQECYICIYLSVSNQTNTYTSNIMYKILLECI